MEAIELLRSYRRPVGLLASGMLLLGTFFPIVNYSALGGYSFFGYSILLALLLFILAIVSAVLAGVQVYRGLWVTGGLAAAICLYSFVQIEMAITRGAEPSQGVIGMLVNSATAPSSIGAGWIVLIPSVVLLLVIAALPDKAAEKPADAGLKPQASVKDL